MKPTPAQHARRRFNESTRALARTVHAFQSALTQHTATRVDLDRVLNAAHRALALQGFVVAAEAALAQATPPHAAARTGDRP